MTLFFKNIRDNFFLISYINKFITSNRYYYLIIISILLLIAYFFLKLPILSIGDTDLWYHLSGGRYFSQNDEIPRIGFFSFLAESREWSNYYWLFQVLVYQIYEKTDYYGLIILKAMIFIITISTIALYLLKDEKNDKQIFYFIIIFILLSIGLIPRYYAFLRPHFFSYLFIPIFIHLIEYRSRPFFLLPVLTILWVNLHGVEYPVIVLICFSYLFEFLITSFKKDKSFTKLPFPYLLSIVLALWTIFINPYGMELFRAPFNFAEHQHQYIKELNPINIADFFTFKLIPLGAMPESILKIVIILACIALIKGIGKKNIRISRLLLLVGGVILLARAQRFQYEAALLMLPMIKSQPLVAQDQKDFLRSSFKRSFVTLILVLCSFFCFYNLFDSKAKYPFSHSHFPYGAITFLNHINTGGSVLSSPDYGGYLQFALNPKYKIAMDLQMALFSDEDYFMVLNALTTETGFASFKDKFHPDYIIIKRGNQNFKDIIQSFSEYRPVFFDNASVLYANEKSRPGLVKQYGLKIINPHSIMEENIDDLDEARTNLLLDELLEMYTICPDEILINFQIGRIYKKRGDLIQASRYADAILTDYPEFPNGYALKGDISIKGNLYEDAISWYQAALNCPIKLYTPLLHNKLALAYSKTGEHKKAYKNMQKAVDVFSPSASYKDIWQLGNMALVIGDIKEGMMLIRFALLKAPNEDEEFIKRVHMQLENLKNVRSTDKTY